MAAEKAGGHHERVPDRTDTHFEEGAKAKRQAQRSSDQTVQNTAGIFGTSIFDERLDDLEANETKKTAAKRVHERILQHRWNLSSFRNRRAKPEQ